MKLMIFVAGRLRYEQPYSLGEAWVVAGALALNLPVMADYSGRAAAVVADGNVVWLMARARAHERMISYDPR